MKNMFKNQICKFLVHIKNKDVKHTAKECNNEYQKIKKYKKEHNIN